MRFPFKTGLTFATSVVALAAFHRWDSSRGLSATPFSEAWSFPNLGKTRTNPIPAAGGQQTAAQGVPSAPTTPVKMVTGNSMQPLAGFLFDSSGALDPFFARLTQMDGAGGKDQVTILHYGDSPTTADLITGEVRTMLQQRFGDAGHGYLLVAKPWAWYGHRDTDISSHGWNISTAVGKGRSEVYGLGGASFEGSAGAYSHITLRGAAPSSMELSYLTEPDGGSVAITADTAAGKGQAVTTVETAAAADATARQPAWVTIPLPAGTTAVDIRPAGGRVDLFGETFVRERSGILYDSLGLNGASTTVLSRGFDRGAWAAELQHAAPALVIINYGTNESSFGSFVDKQYEGELRLAIQRVRNAVPNVSILVMGPMDRGQRSGIDEIDTMDTIPRIVAIQKRVAADTHCAFFDTFNAMGGDGTMSRWYNGSPRLVSADLIHPTPQGASIVAQVFVKNLITGYDIYRARQSGGRQAPAPASRQPEAQP